MTVTELDDTLGSDVSCLVDVNAADIANDPAPIRVIQPASWFDAPGADADIEAMRGAVVDNRAMMIVSVCGDNIGQAQTLVAEDGVPFTGAYPGLPAPVLEGADFRFIHDRPENALQVADGDGNVVAVSAGKAGPRHSPEDIETIDALLDWHDRLGVASTFSDEGVMFRYRLHLVEHDGHELLVARGGLVPGLRWADVFQVMQSEVSPEFIPVETDDGMYLEYAALSLVFHGNTNTTLSMERSGLVRCATMLSVPEGGHDMETVDDIRAAVAAGLIDRAEVLKACGGAPCGPCAEDAAVEPDGLEAELAAMTAERDALLADQFAAIEVDTTPLKARINTHSELRDAVSRAVYALYDTATSWSWVMDFGVDGDKVIYEVADEASGSHIYRESFTVDVDNHTATLSGDRVEVAREVDYVEI